MVRILAAATALLLLMLPMNAEAQTVPTCFGREATIVGTNNPGDGYWDESREDLRGGIGTDVIVGLGGGEVILGEDDVNNNGVIDPEEHGNDFLCGNSDGDWISGGYGADRVNGGGGYDTLFGGHGRDRVVATDGAHDESVEGGPGDDTCIVDELDDPDGSCETVIVR